ncbi:nitrous oxide-stimulated promoter family protein, partial [Candidatus Bathyarchaeota archaeon]|nr:nitrous oxide-stimulated promoter family protein [Candidatus Bathyarchaeota archaeon]
FQEQKPTCFKCKIHCYEPSMRRKIRNVMKYSGPRMFFKQPSLALHHILDGFRKHN